MNLLWIAVCGYLIGGFPTGILLCKLLKGADPRSVGSGVSGATNVSRVLGKAWAIVVVVVDALKGYLPVQFIVPLLAPGSLPLGQVIMAAALVAGHVWTPYAGLRGGKGVATGAGAMIAVDGRAVLAALIVWLLLALLFRFVSLASIGAAIALPLAMLLLGARPPEHVVLGVLLAAFVIFTHRSNIGRLLRHEEARFF